MSTPVVLLTALVVGRAAGPLVEVLLARRRARCLQPELEARGLGTRYLLPQVRRRGAVEDRLPEALDAIARSLRSGATIGAALEEAASAVSGTLADDLRRVARQVPVQGAAAALEEWARSRPESGVRLAAAALVLGAESGGAPARAVDGVSAGLRARAALTAEVRALSSQARLSAAVIAAAPLAFGVLASATDAGVAAVLFGTPLGAVLLAAGLGLDLAGGLWMLRLCRSRPADGVSEELPEIVELFAAAVRAGLTVRLAAEVVAASSGPSRGLIGAELQRAVTRCGHGMPLADALAELPDRAGEPLRPLVAALVDADRYGTPLGPALDRLAADAREELRRGAEERARRIPVLLLFPLVFCILPAFGLLTVAPLLAGALDALAL